ncbi:AAA domain-containing protein [Cryobacterium psychrophilum]|nr:AAA domain-containing protein [Cryobacterium psychrophilum]
MDAAEHASLRLTPPDLASSPVPFQRDDGTSVFRPKHSIVFTSTELLDAETWLLERAAELTAPRLAATALRSVARTQLPGGGRLAEDQIAALLAIASSGRVVDVLVGPAGAGKTTAMNALRRAGDAQHGAGSVVGLAPSAAAATVLATDLGVPTENLAKWWQNHGDHGATFRAGQLVIIDEASLAGTLPLDRVTAIAANAGAKVLLVGDYAQLQSVDAGGAFSLLVHDRADAPELIDVHRFVYEWEKTASLALRQGNSESIDHYAAHDRLRDGTTEEMADAAYDAWRADVRAGKATVLISDSNEAVASLNERARTELILEGRIDALREVALHDGTRAAVGDTVITRRNDRRLFAPGTWVRNGDRWAVIGVRRNGAIEVRRPGRRWGSTVLLPADYVKSHVELGYAVTTHRAQGITTDTAHVVVASSMPRENLDIPSVLSRVVAARGLEDAQDIAAVLRVRVAAVVSRDSGAGRSRRVPRLVAGLIPRAIGPMDAAMSRALVERSDLMESRASAILDQALRAGETWTRALGVAPRGSASAAWRQHACTVSSYRDRYGIVGARALGAAPDSTAQKLDAARAHAALEAAHRLAEKRQAHEPPRRTVAVGMPPAGIRF